MKHEKGTKPLVEVKHLKKHFDVGRGQILKAVDDVSFDIYPGRLSVLSASRAAANQPWAAR